MWVRSRRGCRECCAIAGSVGSLLDGWMKKWKDATFPMFSFLSFLVVLTSSCWCEKSFPPLLFLLFCGVKSRLEAR